MFLPHPPRLHPHKTSSTRDTLYLRIRTTLGGSLIHLLEFFRRHKYSVGDRTEPTHIRTPQVGNREIRLFSGTDLLGEPVFRGIRNRIHLCRTSSTGSPYPLLRSRGQCTLSSERLGGKGVDVTVDKVGRILGRSH